MTKSKEHPCIDILSSLDPSYDWKFANQLGSDVLLVVMSSKPALALVKYKFKYSCPFISDKTLTYYIKNPGRQSKIIQEFIEKSGYKKVLFIGSSKGGTGALLWPALIGKRNPKFNISILVFSPITLLYPYNPTLSNLPSYLKSISLMDKNETHKRNMLKYGNIVEYLNEFAGWVKVIYSEGCMLDRTEALRLKQFSKENYEFATVPLSFHGSISPFVTPSGDLPAIKKMAEKLFKDAENDIDLKSNLPPSKEDFISMFLNINAPTLNELIDDCLLK